MGVSAFHSSPRETLPHCAIGTLTESLTPSQHLVKVVLECKWDWVMHGNGQSKHPKGERGDRRRHRCIQGAERVVVVPEEVVLHVALGSCRMPESPRKGCPERVSGKPFCRKGGVSGRQKGGVSAETPPFLPPRKSRKGVSGIFIKMCRGGPRMH